MRCAIYARYSSDRQSPNSIEDQVALCRKFIEGKGGTVVEPYADYAISGASSSRPAFEKMLTDASASRFDVIVSEAMDRLSRDQADIATLHKKCQFLGIQILTVAEGEVRELEIGLKGTMNALFLRDLAAKTKRGQAGRVDAGLAAGGLTFGYDVVRELAANGEPARGKRAINEQQAAIVRRIFDEYNAGKSPRSIARDLNAEGIPSPRGGQWGASTINGSRQRRNGILHNELYIGLMMWNRQTFHKDPDTGKRISRPNAQSDWKVIEVPHLRIVTDEQWDLAQARTVDRKPTLHKTRRAKRLLSGLLKCGECGGSYTIASRKWVQCFNYRERGSCTNNRMMAVDEIESRVMEGLRDQLVTPELMAEFAREYKDEVKRLRHRSVGRKAQLETELKTIDRELKNVVDAIAAAGINASLKTRLLTAEARKVEIKGELATLDASPVVELHPNLPEIFKRRVTELQEALNAGQDMRQEAAEILRALIDKIVLAPNEAGGLDIQLYGHLATVLSLAHSKGEAVTALVVAGARNQRYQQGLFQAAA